MRHTAQPGANTLCCGVTHFVCYVSEMAQR
nr:MAG TPA: hypothetical protein [Caudoviricetes sp.]